jgi:hypothetical protein
MYTIVSNRFTDTTWNQNQEYKQKHNLSGCIYGSPQRLSPKIEINSLLYVIEMNNTTNKTLGIGIIRNAVQYDKYYQVYETGNYNRYIFKGKYRLDREELPEMLVHALDYILFKEKTHMKRGAGMTTVPAKLLRHPKVGELDVRNEIKNAFVRKYSDEKEV